MESFRERLGKLSIFQRIAIGNSIIIVIGAVGGTLITRHFTITDEWGLIVLFASVGTILSVTLNSWIIRNALRPLRELRKAVDQIRTGIIEDSSFLIKDSDPDITRLSQALNTLVKQLDKRNRQLRALSEQVINTQEEERQRIALSLHDDTGQALSMLIINLDRLENKLPADEAVLKKKLASSRFLAEHALNELRAIVRDLRPTMLDNLGLVPAIRWYARSNLEEAGIRVTITADGDMEALPGRLSITLFRIAQEAINNAVRHSNANSVDITLRGDPNCVVLVIEDDGIGFDRIEHEEQTSNYQKWGLVGIKERTELVGGKLTIESEPNKGARLIVQVPLDSSGG